MNNSLRAIYNNYVSAIEDDITFCGDYCQNVLCRRHQSNIRHPEWPHSYSNFFGTKECPFDETGLLKKGYNMNGDVEVE